MTVIDSIHAALATVEDPEIHRPLPDLGMVESVQADGGVARLKILLTISGCPMQDRLRTDITKAVMAVESISSVEITFGVMDEEQRGKLKSLLRNGREKIIPFAQPESLTRVIGIASGKGGVGKSSLTVNLAVAAASKGLRVGILDADVYGHSVPRLMGLIGQRPTAIDQMFIPLEAYGVKVVSMEMFKPERSDAVAYRGPLLHKVLEQLLSDAYWGDLDLLLIDLPPGTGDLAISLGQLIPGSEILVVTTPQEAAQKVARLSAAMAKKVNLPVRGVIENMSWFTGDDGKRYELFGSGGGQELADELGVPLLAQIPLTMALREGGDDGKPIAAVAPDSETGKAFHALAAQVDAMKPKKLFSKGLKLLG